MNISYSVYPVEHHENLSTPKNESPEACWARLAKMSALAKRCKVEEYNKLNYPEHVFEEMDAQ